MRVDWGRGGGDQVVTVLPFNSDDRSSNPAEVYNFYSIKLFVMNENKRIMLVIKNVDGWILTFDFWMQKRPCRSASWLTALLSPQRSENIKIYFWTFVRTKQKEESLKTRRQTD